MFNDEIEMVRLEAIESLTLIANHITLQVHQVSWTIKFVFMVQNNLVCFILHAIFVRVVQNSLAYSNDDHIFCPLSLKPAWDDSFGPRWFFSRCEGKVTSDVAGEKQNRYLQN